MEQCFRETETALPPFARLGMDALFQETSRCRKTPFIDMWLDLVKPFLPRRGRIQVPNEKSNPKLQNRGSAKPRCLLWIWRSFPGIWHLEFRIGKFQEGSMQHARRVGYSNRPGTRLRIQPGSAIP